MPALHDAVRRLCDVLEAENAVLTRLEFGQIEAFQQDKREALAALDGHTAGATDPATIEDPAPVIRLQHLVAENRRLLEQAILVQKRVMAVLASAARTAQTPVGYGRMGRRPSNGGPHAVALIMRA